MARVVRILPVAAARTIAAHSEFGLNSQALAGHASKLFELWRFSSRSGQTAGLNRNHGGADDARPGVATAPFTPQQKKGP